MKDYVVIVTHHDGSVIESNPLTEAEARSDCDAIKELPTVRSAVVVKRPDV